MKLTYASPDRQLFTLIGSKPSDYKTVFVANQTIEGLVGAVENEGIQVMDVAGRLIDHRDDVFAPIEGAMTVVGVSAEGLSRFCRSWSTRREGVLTVTGSASVLSLPVRLATPIVFPPSGLRAGAQATLEVVGDRGWWGESRTGSGTVTVDNTGEVWCWPTVRWASGGVLTMPSGVAYTLPTLSTHHRLSFSPHDSGRVTNATTSMVNRAVSDTLGVVGEGVAPGHTARFVVPAGATLEYEIGFLSPWQRI